MISKYDEKNTQESESMQNNSLTDNSESSFDEEEELQCDFKFKFILNPQKLS